MPRIERTAEVTWAGNVARGDGRVSATSGAFGELPFSLPSRIGAVQGKTSPEELLAAAHAGCLTMAVASELTEAGTPPARLEVRCTIVMDQVESGDHEIVASHITVGGDVEGLDDAMIERADAGCPFSKLLKRAGAEVAVSRA